MVASEAARQGVDPALALRVARQESGFRSDARSPKGAVGPMQLLPSTAADLGVDPTDPAQNVKGGVAYLKRQMDTFGDPALAAAAYNAGPGAVRKYGGVPPFAETKNYVSAVASPQDVSRMSNAELLALYGATKPTAPPQKAAPPAARVQPTPAPQRGAGLDAVLGFLSGSQKGASGMADAVNTVNPLTPVLGALQSAANVAGLMQGKAPAKPAAPPAMMARIAAQNGYAPQTTAGHVAQTVGTMLPNAIIPGSATQRAANVVLPALGQEGGERTAKAAGLGTQGQQVAGMLGATLGGLGASMRLSPKTVKATPQTLDQLEQAKRDAYAAVDASGFTFPNSDVQQIADNIGAEIRAKGGPKAAELLKDSDAFHARLDALAKSPGGVPLSQLDDLRSDAYDMLVKPGGKDSIIGGSIRRQIDGLVNASGAPDIQTARNANAQYMKYKDIAARADSADLRAASTYAGGNKANALRQNLRPLIDPKSPQRIVNFTPDEAAAVNRVVRGSAGANALRLAGKTLDPRGLLGQGVQTMMGIPTHGLSALSVPLGVAASEASNSATQNSLQSLLDLISTGGVKSASAPPVTFSADPYAGLAGLTAPLLAASPAIASARQPKKRPQPR
jgi:hypothetical protein